MADSFMRTHLPARPAGARAALVLLVASLLAVGTFAVPARAATLERTHGDDRVETAIEASKASGDSARTALLTDETAYPDALVAGALAAHHDAPLLLNPRTGLAQEVRDELTRLGVEEVLVLGGERTVPTDVAEDLDAAGFQVRRLAGEDRYATAAAVAGQVGTTASGEVLLALGADEEAANGWPDAAAAASLLGTETAPPTLHAPAVAGPREPRARHGAPARWTGGDQ